MALNYVIPPMSAEDFLWLVASEQCMARYGECAQVIAQVLTGGVPGGRPLRYPEMPWQPLYPPRLLRAKEEAFIRAYFELE